MLAALLERIAVFVVQNQELVVGLNDHSARAGIVLGVVERFVRAFKKLLYGLHMRGITVQNGYAGANGDMQVVFFNISFRITDKKVEVFDKADSTCKCNTLKVE